MPTPFFFGLTLVIFIMTEYRTIVVSNCRNIEQPKYRTVGISASRNNDLVSDYQTVGILSSRNMNCRNKEQMSEYRNAGISSCRNNGLTPLPSKYYLIHCHYIIQMSVEIYDSCFMFYANNARIQFKIPDLAILSKSPVYRVIQTPHIYVW